MRVHGDISDLFFNLDLAETKVFDGGQFVEFDDARLREEATWFLAALERLGVVVPTVDELIEDFLKRI